MEKVKVSIVEDIDEVRESIGKLLQGSDKFTLTSSFTNAEQAEKNLPREKPDIVIMDISLPGRSGIECLQKIKENCGDTQFIMYTIFEDDEKVFEALEAGASGYLLKKTPKEKILESLMELYEGGSPMSTQIARKVIEAFQRRKMISEEERSLTKKEKEVLDLLAKGFLYKEIADKLSITINTVKQHIHSVYEKLHVTNKAEAINKIYVKK